MREILVRFLIGGIAVSFFSVLGDLFKPKSFAGLFWGSSIGGARHPRIGNC